MRKAVVLFRNLDRVIKRPRLAFRYLIFERETTNFTYEITNTHELVTFLSGQFSAVPWQIQSYIGEIDMDIQLRADLNTTIQRRKGGPSRALYGRRVGWYAIIRLIRPRLVVESGVHDGLGSSVLLAALARNAAEGWDGRLIAIDVNANSGWMIPRSLRGRLELLIEDAILVLRRMPDASVDLFIHDSLHTYEHQSSEYAAIEHALSPTAVIIADDAHDVIALSDFSRSRNRRYAIWREHAEHFYGGSSLGLSLPSLDVIH